MIRPLIFLLFGAALLCLVASAAPVPKEAEKPNFYFPTQVGTKWVYQQGDQEWTEIITEVETRAGATIVTVGRRNPDGKMVTVEKVSVFETGLYRTFQNGTELSQQCLLLLPGKTGAVWDCDFIPKGKVVGVAGRALCRGGAEVEVPAGRFKAIRVDES